MESQKSNCVNLPVDDVWWEADDMRADLSQQWSLTSAHLNTIYHQAEYNSHIRENIWEDYPHIPNVSTVLYLGHNKLSLWVCSLLNHTKVHS